MIKRKRDEYEWIFEVHYCNDHPKVNTGISRTMNPWDSNGGRGGDGPAQWKFVMTDGSLQIKYCPWCGEKLRV